MVFLTGRKNGRFCPDGGSAVSGQRCLKQKGIRSRGDHRRTIPEAQGMDEGISGQKIKIPRTTRWIFIFWRSGRDSNPRAVARKLISSPVLKRSFQKKAGQSWSVCPRIFGGVKPFSRGRSPKNGFGTNQTGIPRFGPVWQDFLEKCKISRKIIGG